MCETLNEIHNAKQIVAFQTMVSQEALKDKLINLIKREHSCLLVDDLESVFSEVVESFRLEELQIYENFKNFKGGDDGKK